MPQHARLERALDVAVDLPGYLLFALYVVVGVGGLLLGVGLAIASLF